MLLMLALPLQAFASAAMLGCTFSHQAAMTTPMATADDAMDGCHEHESGQPDRPAAPHDCKHCAACALGAVLPIPVVGNMPVLPVPAGFASHPAAVFSGFIPDGPERPPRPFLA